VAAPRFGREALRAAVVATLLSFMPSCSRRSEPLLVVADASPSTPRVTTSAEVQSVAEPTEPVTPALLDRCDGEPPALPERRAFAACDATKSVEKLTILHVSDMHGHIHPYLGNSRAPFAVLRAFADRKRAESGNRVLFVDAGDDLEKGSLIELRSRGEVTVHLLDHLGLDARTLGNHDFAWGEASVRKQVASPSHAVIASNIGVPDVKRTAVFEVGCVRVGLFGIVINPYDETDERIDAPYLEKFAHEHDPGDADRYVSIATTLVRELRDEQKVDVVIGVDHLGLVRDKAIADAVPGIDLIVSAHDHQSLNGYAQGKFAPLVATGTFLGGKNDARVGEATLEIDLETRQVRLTSARSTRLEELRDLDASVQAEVERLQRCFAPDADTPVAELDAPLGPYQLDALNSLFDAALRAKFPEASAFVYEAWTYGGIVRGDLPRGPITPQMIADFAYSERQRAGGPGFTAFQPMVVTGADLRALCSAPLRESTNQRMHRVCPSAIDDAGKYTVVLERRPLFAPNLAFTAPPSLTPTGDEYAVEAMDLLIDYARVNPKWSSLGRD